MRAKIHIGIRVALPILMTGQTSQEATMKRSIVVLIAAVALIGASRASAQEVAPGPGALEVTVIPGGAQFFTSKNGLPDFGNYTLGGDLAYNFNRIVGVEGEVGTSLGISQDLAFGGLTRNLKTPNILNYTGNVLVSAATGSPVVPYATGGIGGMTMFERASLGITSNETFLTGNAGGGVKWYAPNGRWGLRGDYRFIYVRANGSTPAFFGQDDRYSHRFYGGVIINAIR